MVQLITIYSGADFEDVGINRISAFLDINQIENLVIHIEQDKYVAEKYAQLKNGEYFGISVYGSNVIEAAELGRYIKKENPNAIIFWGSQYVSLAYEELLKKYMDAVDIMVLGDGEYPILSILENEEKQILEITKKSPFLASKDDYMNKRSCLMDIQDLPWPKHDVKLMKKHLYTTIKTSTGCAGNCAFCGFLRRKWTGYTGSQVYEELVRIRKEYGIRAFMFADNSFEDPGLMGKKRIGDLLDCIESGNEKFSFFANIRAESFKDNCSDIQLLERMKKCGFSQLFVGIESGNDDDLRLYNKRATVQDNHKILDILQRANIEAKWGFIMLNPYSTQDKLRKNYDFLVSNYSYDPFHYMSFLMIYINSQLYTKTLDDNLLLDSFDKMEANYLFLDPFAQKVYNFFVKKYNQTELQYRFKQFKDSLLLYFHLSQITNAEFSKEVTAIKSQLAELNKQFFGIIYIGNDFELAERTFPEYTREMINACNQFAPIKGKMLREYVSFCKHGG